tara:strand:+ start:3399 stop:4100 length:702 start_codon:yes stop_codon:yes gene_type:complete
MVKVVFIKKTGTLKNSSVKLNNVNELYKKCLFSSNKNFSKRHTWTINNNKYSIFAKSSGKSGNENKYELPPPIDNQLYFGTMVAVKHVDDNFENMLDLTLTEWDVVYEELFGGFEDIENDEEESQEEYVDPKNLTKEGYDKSDGFIVDDDDSISLDSDSGENISEYDDNYDEEEDDEEEVDDEEEEVDEEEDDEEEDDEDEDDEDEDDEDDEDEYYEDDKDYLTEESFSDEDE